MSNGFDLGPSPMGDPKSTRLFVRHSIGDDIWSSQSGSAILSELRNQGIHIRTQDFYAVRREVLQDIETRGEIGRTLGDQLIPRALMTDKFDVNMTKNAQYRVSMEVLDPETGEPVIVKRSLSSDQHLTLNEVLDFAEEYFTSGGEGYNYIINQVSLDNVWIRPGTRLTR